MHIDIVPNRNSKPAILLRESYRENGKVKKRTIANLSSLSMDQVDALRLVLKGEKLAPVEDLFDITRSRLHGHVDAVLKLVKKLKLDRLLGARRSRNRDLCLAMIVMRVLDPQSKLATARSWNGTTLPELLEVEDADENELYQAMDWLLEQQDRIEKKLASKQLSEGCLALYDLSSSYFEGRCCPLAARGHNRDGKRGKLQVNYGLLTNSKGCPVSISVFPGNTSDGKTLMQQATKLRESFGLSEVVLVGDRGMISQKQIEGLKDCEGLSWITAIRSQTLRKLLDNSEIQLGLFDERNLFEFKHPDYPGERLVACRNPELADRRARKRQDLIESTKKELDLVVNMVKEGRMKGRAKIGVRTGRVLNKFKVAKHFDLSIEDDSMSYEVKSKSVELEASLDGLYVIRSSVAEEQLNSSETVLAYKKLSAVEQAFRSFKGLDLLVRPIHHYAEGRVKAHLLICMLAYYLQWHLIEAWKPLLFCDEDEERKERRDAVAAAEKSVEAKEKAAKKKLEDGSEVHSFRTLLKRLAGIVRNTCKRGKGDSATEFEVDTRPDRKQQEALDLIAALKV